MLPKLNDVICNLTLSKIKAEVFLSRLQERNLLERNVMTSAYHNHEKDLLTFFSPTGNMSYCNYVDGLMKSSDTITRMKNGDCSLVHLR
jgi:hypothetical protein